VSFLVSLVTPFDARGRVDLAKLRAHVLWLSAHGVEGFITSGAAGEFLYLSDREREAVQRTVLDAAMGRVVLPCTWDPSPTTTTYLTDAAFSQGARAVILPPPLYYDVDAEALEAWYAPVAGKGPVLTVHDPRRIRTPVAPAVYDHLRQRGLITGMLDASDDRWRLERLVGEHPGEVWVADDRGLARPRPHGVAGFVSVLANVWPTFCLRVWRGEKGLEQAVVERFAKVEQAGGVRALKSLLRMGCRAPLVAPADARLLGLAPPDQP
jgi:4-hydroxy-tetrahydrodipicolinate synthase